MTDRSFRPGEVLWLRGDRVTFVDYHGYAQPYRVAAAVVRRTDRTETRVVPLRKLARDRRESITRATTLRAS
jgi:hypothetical protein